MLELYRLLTLLFCLLSIQQTITATAINVPIQNIPDSLIQSALNSLNQDSPTKHRYKSGNLITAQKLLRPPYVIHHLTLSLEVDCKEEPLCPREICIIDVKQNEQGIIEVDEKTAQCHNNLESRHQRANREDSLLGEETSISIDHKIKDYAKKGLKHYSASNDINNEFLIVEIVSATRRLVSGISYRIKVRIGETNCTKGQLEDTCVLVENSPIKDCIIFASIQSWMSAVPEITVECESNSRRKRALCEKIFEKERRTIEPYFGAKRPNFGTKEPTSGTIKLNIDTMEPYFGTKETKLITEQPKPVTGKKNKMNCGTFIKR